MYELSATWYILFSIYFHLIFEYSHTNHQYGNILLLIK